MKKVYLNSRFSLAEEQEAMFTLFAGVDRVDDWYIIQTERSYGTQEKPDDDDTNALKARINAVLADPSTPWQTCDAQDAAFVARWRRIWGAR